MKQKFIDNYMSIVMNNKTHLSSDDIEKFKYAIEGIYLTITKLLVIFILGLFLNILKEIIIVLIFYNFLRYFGFGYHAKGSKECLIISIVFFVILPLLIAKNIIIFKYKIPIFIICMINFFLFAPSDTKKRPMVNKKKKLKRKVSILIVTLIYYFICTRVSYEMSSLIVLSIIVEGIMVNPVIYKLTGEPYNNYKSYLKQN